MKMNKYFTSAETLSTPFHINFFTKRNYLLHSCGQNDVGEELINLARFMNIRLGHKKNFSYLKKEDENMRKSTFGKFFERYCRILIFQVITNGF